MQRKIIDKMKEWKQNKERLPLLLTGVKDVGKTFLACDFGNTFFEEIIYINFEHEQSAINIFQNEEVIVDNVQNIVKKIAIRHHRSEEDLYNKESLLLILDEVSLLPSDCLHPENFYNLNCLISTILISSYPFEVIPSNKTSSMINSNYITHFTVYPMDFEEFLHAIGKEWYIDVMKEHNRSNKSIPTIVHHELLILFHDYIIIGGMPASISEYINTGNLYNIKEIHNRILEYSLNNLSHIVEDRLALKIRQVMESLPVQLNKYNKKFQYNMIRKGVTKIQYIDAIDYIKMAQLGLLSAKILDINDNKVKWSIDTFKLYHFDTGMLHSGFSKTDIDIQKSLYENYVAQTLSENGYQLYFWESKSIAKLDFVIEKEGILIPIEVSPNENTRSKRVSAFKEMFPVKDSIKISTRNFDYSHTTKYIPIYAASLI